MEIIKILNIKFRNINIFDGEVNFDFFTNDRVVENTGTYNIGGSINTNSIISMVGLNAVGKTSLLKIIDFILGIVINNKSLNETNNLILASSNDFGFDVVFYYKESYHKLSCFIEKRLNQNHPEFVYRNEFLRSINKSNIKSKVNLKEFIEERLDESNSDVVRNNLDDTTTQLLKSDDSIVTLITKSVNLPLRQMIDNVNLNLLSVDSSVSSEVLNFFDSNIDYIRHENNDVDSNVVLKFKNSNGFYSSSNRNAWGEIISSGTIKGNSLVDMSLDVLKTGGYLIIDELENHLNKQLIKIFIDLFKDPLINKKGATIIFSTHYPELMDFMERLDNIYLLTRNESNRAKLNLLSEYVKRNDIKKSDIILSNYIKGTSPSYKSVMTFKNYIKSEVINEQN